MTRKFVEAVYFDDIPLYAIYTRYVWWLFVIKDCNEKAIITHICQTDKSDFLLDIAVNKSLDGM